MERSRAAAAVIGTLAAAGVGYLLYQIYSSDEKIKRHEYPCHTLAATMNDTPNSNTITSTNCNKTLIKLEELDGNDLANLESLLPGHIDCAEYTDVAHGDSTIPVLVQYVEEGVIDSIPRIDGVWFALPMGKIVFDDQSSAILYSGEAVMSLVNIPGDDDGAIKDASLFASILSDMLKVLCALEEHGLSIEATELLASTVIDPSGQVLILGRHLMMTSLDDISVAEKVYEVAVGMYAHNKDGVWADTEAVLTLCDSVKSADSVEAVRAILEAAMREE
jgi:hypothetical protein